MSERYAVVDSSGLVVNVVLWDGNAESWQPPEQHQAILSLSAGPGWLLSNGEFIAPYEERPTTPPEQRIAARRYDAETAGITVNGMHLPTYRDSQALVTGAALAAVIDPAYHCQWKTTEGFIDLDAQQIIGIASTMRAHVQACFDREAALLDALATGTYTDEQLDQGWPE